MGVNMATEPAAGCPRRVSKIAAAWNGIRRVPTVRPGKAAPSRTGDIDTTDVDGQSLRAE